jgi:hypothetical protein
VFPVGTAQRARKDIVGADVDQTVPTGHTALSQKLRRYGFVGHGSVRIPSATIHISPGGAMNDDIRAMLRDEFRGNTGL